MPRATKAAPAKSAPAKKSTASRKNASASRKNASASRKNATKSTKSRKKGAPLDKFLEGQLSALEAERATYLRQAETLQAEADSLTEDREPGDVQFDEESGEGDTLAVERERDLALSAQARQSIEQIDAAVRKVHEGTYGLCESCGSPIPKERLKALPHAALCVKCKSGGLGLGR
jgi:RNA polymerase-binding protein DksA